MFRRRVRSASSLKDGKQQGVLSRMRIAVFGHGNVGKTSIIKRFLYDTFDKQYKETIEDIYRQDVVCNNQVVDLTILDSAGQFQFPAMRRLAIQQSEGFIIVYAIDNIVSFNEAKRLRDIIVEQKDSIDVPIFLVGNKIDGGFRRITPNEVTSTVELWGKKVQHIETSAKTNYNINLVFNNIIGMIDEQNHERLEINSLRSMNRTPFSNMRYSFKQKTRRLSGNSEYPTNNNKEKIHVTRCPINELAVRTISDPHQEFQRLKNKENLVKKRRSTFSFSKS